jgi:hypothetical protein
VSGEHTGGSGVDEALAEINRKLDMLLDPAAPIFASSLPLPKGLGPLLPGGVVRAQLAISPNQAMPMYINVSVESDRVFHYRFSDAYGFSSRWFTARIAPDAID